MGVRDFDGSPGGPLGQVGAMVDHLMPVVMHHDTPKLQAALIDLCLSGGQADERGEEYCTIRVESARTLLDYVNTFIVEEG